MNIDHEKKILEVLKQVYPRRMRVSTLSKKTGLSKSDTEKEVAYLREKKLVGTDVVFGFHVVWARAAGIDFLVGKKETIEKPEIMYCPLTGSGCNKHLKKQSNLYFVAHRFTKKRKKTLRKAIETALEKFELIPFYADDEVKSQHVACKICEKIRISKFGIFDISGGNPNVTFELGLAWGFGKSLLIIAKRRYVSPSDLRGLDILKYESYKDLTKKLKTEIKSFVV